MAKRRRKTKEEMERDEQIARGKRIGEERAKRLGAMTDDELLAAYAEAHEGYVQRLEYFAELPRWMLDEFGQIAERGPAAYGLTPGEWEQLCADRWAHLVEGFKLGDISKERHRRLHDAARRAVSSCADVDAARAMKRGYDVPEGPPCHYRTDGETIRDFVQREERYYDAVHESFGASSGWFEVLDADRRREIERAKRENAEGARQCPGRR